MKSFPLAKVYQLLEPGPVVLLATARRGRPNVMAMSWHMMVDFEPPLLACVVSNNDYSYAALRATKQCVIAIPAAKLARKVVQIGNSSGRDIDKFAALRPDALARVPGRTAAGGRVLRKFGMPCRRHALRQPLWHLHPRSGAGLDRSAAEKNPRPSIIAAMACSPSTAQRSP